jgi:hypothetical protein
MRCSGRNISRLTALRSAAEQHNLTGACSCEIHTIAGPAIDAKFPDAVTAEPMVAGIAACQSINASQYRHPTPEIDQAIEPSLEMVPAGWRQVVFYVDSHFRF